MIDKQKTRILMICSAIFMATIGFVLSFIPQELLEYFGGTPDGISVMIINIAGGLYIGFGFLNWMAKDNIIGAIYSRPVAAGNFIHFMMAAIILFKQVTSMSHFSLMLILALLNTLFAVGFGYLLLGGGKVCK